MRTVLCRPLALFAGILITHWHAAAAEAPLPRSRAAVEAVLARAPRSETKTPLRQLHVLLVAGPKDHGPGEHDYPSWQLQWTALLAKAPGVRVSTAFPWPKPEQWEGVDLAVFYLKTRWDAQQLAEIQRHQSRGGGVVTIHWAIGCDQDWENHARYFGLSYKAASYRHGLTELRLPNPDHPLLLGLPQAMRFVDEPYWPFIGDPNRIQVLATSVEKINQGDDRSRNPGDGTVETVPVFWTYQPPGTDARVFVSIFGHYMWTFDDPFFRLMLLRGMSWAAKETPYRLDPLALEGLKLADIPPSSPGPASRIITPPVVESADDTVYANRPYWYKPGHPLNPAESSTIHTLPGFKADRIFTMPANGGSLTALAVDPQGRLLAAAQHHAGIYRITPPAIGDVGAETKVEKLGGAAARVGWSHGLLHAFDSLYVTVSEGNDSAKKGLHRLRDTDGDDQFDQSEVLFELKGGGEHEPLPERMAADTGDRPLLGSGNFVRNPKYGAAVSDMLQSAPRIERMHCAMTMLWLAEGWTKEQRRQYFASIADALSNSRGGHQYREFWGRIRETALRQVPEDQRAEFEAIKAPGPALAEGVPVAKGPGRDWTLDQALDAMGRELKGRDARHGRDMFAAAGCVLCHQINGEGGAVGPDLSTLGQRFTVRDILEATIYPSKAIPDQYQMVTLELADGRTLSGRIVSRDERITRIATDLMRPTESASVSNAAIRKSVAQPVSTMPTGLLNALNEDELLDLVAYLKGAVP